VERARALAPAVSQWRDAGEQERHVPRPLFEALRGAGIFRMSAPTAVGGGEAAEATVLQAIEELARQDGSVEWNVMIASNTAVIASYLPAAAPTPSSPAPCFPRGWRVRCPGASA
jgi:indole-3-acetate monooxygenase